METLKEIKKLQSNAASIKKLFNELIPLWKSDPKTYDKTRWGFTEGNSDGWYPEMRIYFHAWCGTYGDSSTYNQIDYDGDVFKKHFLSYLNNNKQEIMLEIAKSINNEAVKLKEKAQEELQDELNKLIELTEG